MKILLVQTSFLGDTILSSPVVAGIKKRYPESELWMLTTPLSSSLVKRDPLLKGVISFNKCGEHKGLSGLIKMAGIIRAYQFDKVYSITRTSRTALLLFLAQIPERTGFKNAGLGFLYHIKVRRTPERHDVLRNLEILSSEIPLNRLSTKIRLFPPNRKELSKKTEGLIPKGESYAVIAPGSTWPTKIWDVKGYRKVAEFLVSKGFKVVLSGNQDDLKACRIISKSRTDIINLAGKTSLSEALYITKNAKLLVCNDSMHLHMGSAFKVPTVVVFCSTIPEFGFGPWENRSIIVEKKLPCRPCGRHGKKRCPEKTNTCMTKIHHNEVIQAVKSLI